MGVVTTNMYRSVWSKNTSWPVGPTSWDRKTYKFQRMHNGDDFPNYKSLIHKGINATNRLNATEQTLSYVKGYLKMQAMYDGKMCFGESEWLYPTPYALARSSSQALTDSADNQAKIAAILKIREQMGSINGVTQLGEFRETLQWIRNPFEQIRKRTDLLYKQRDLLHQKKLNAKKEIQRLRNKKNRTKGQKVSLQDAYKVLKDYSNDVASVYLEWTFAIAPNVGVIDDIVEASMARLEDMRTIRLSGSGYKESANITSNGWMSIGTGVNSQQCYDLVMVDTSRVQYVVWYDSEIKNFDSIFGRIKSQAFLDDSLVQQLSMAAWELTYLSWMVDYFTNIGDLLQCNFDYNAAVKFGYKAVTKFSADYNIHTGVRTDKGFQRIDFRPPHLVTTNKSYSRTAITDLGIFPRLAIDLPGTTDQFKNMAAFFRLKFDKFLK